MDIITVNTKALNYIDSAIIYPGQYENGALYLALYDTEEQELYTDLSTYIMPVLPDQFYVEKNSESERFVIEQTELFTCLDITVKQGFNTYVLYMYNGIIK